MERQVKMLSVKDAEKLAHKLMRHNKRQLATWMAQDHGKGAFAQAVIGSVGGGKATPRKVSYYMAWSKAELVQAIIENEYLVMWEG